MLDTIQSIADSFSIDVERAAKMTRRDVVMIGLATLFGLTAFVAGVAALSIYASELYGAVETAMVICLAGIFAMLVVIAVLRFKQRQDRLRAERADARYRIVTTLGTALLPMLLKSRAGGTAALIGGAAIVAKELLKSTPDRAQRRAARHRVPPGLNSRVKGAVNPYLRTQAQENLR